MHPIPRSAGSYTVHHPVQHGHPVEVNEPLGGRQVVNICHCLKEAKKMFQNFPQIRFSDILLATFFSYINDSLRSKARVTAIEGVWTFNNKSPVTAAIFLS